MMQGSFLPLGVLVFALVSITPGQAAPPLPVAPPIDVSDGGRTLLGRFIGIHPGPNTADCPPLSPLFPGRHLFAAPGQQGALPPALRDFCVYDYAEGPGGPITPAQMEVLMAGATWSYGTPFGPDRAVVYGAGTLADVYQTSSAELTISYAGAPLSMPVGDPARDVRLTIVDNLPDVVAPWTVQWPEHGRTLANLMRRLSCAAPWDACAVDLHARLAMPLVDNGDLTLKREPTGGEFGSIGLLAEAIRSEVEAWNAGSAQALVLNLSLAWHRVYGGADPLGVWPPDVLAAHAVLLDAQCRGALIVAAAGNLSGGQLDRAGPALPAAWATDIVTKAECSAALEGLADADPAAFGRPLLYSAGAVGRDLEPIGLSRPDNLPAWTGYGDEVAFSDYLGVPVPVRSGTSYGAAVVSTSAALVAAWRDDLSMHEVMEEIHAGGALVGDVSPHYDIPQLPDEARRVRACQALYMACKYAPAGSACDVGNLPTCDGYAPPLVADPAELAVLDASASGGGVIHSSIGAPWGECAWLEIFDTAPGFVQPCPMFQFYDISVSPFTHPTPNDGPCSSCTVEVSSHTVRLESDTIFSEHQDATLTLNYTDGTSAIFHLPALPADTKVTKTLDPNKGYLDDLLSVVFTSTIDEITDSSEVGVVQ